MNEQAAMMNQQQQHQHLMSMNPNTMTINQVNPLHQQQAQTQMLPINRNYGIWPPPQPLPQFKNPNPNIGAMNRPPPDFNNSSNLLGPRNNWKGKRINKLDDKRRKEPHKSLMLGSGISGPGDGVDVINGRDARMSFNNYNMPTLNELQYQNRIKARKFFPKKKFNKNNSLNMNIGFNNNASSRSAPFAPRNTTSFLIRAKKSGGIASLVSPCPVTPAVLPTPIFSPSREVLVDMAKEEWGVDGYGSMKGLIRLKSPGNGMEVNEEEEDDGGSSESDVEEHVEVERRLDHDLSRFEMIYNPNDVNVVGMEYHNVLENRVDDQDTHIAQLEEENVILKERLFLMERELGELTRRLQCLEGRRNKVNDDEEIEENESDDESESRGYAQSMEENNNESDEENVNVNCCFKGKKGDNGNHGFDEKLENDNVAYEKVVDNETDAECKVGGKDNGDFDEKVENCNITAESLVKHSDEPVQNKNFVQVEEMEQNKESLDKFVTVEIKKDATVKSDVDLELPEHPLVDGDICTKHVEVSIDCVPRD